MREGAGTPPSTLPPEGVRPHAPLGVLLELPDDIPIAVSLLRHDRSVGLPLRCSARLARGLRNKGAFWGDREGEERRHEDRRWIAPRAVPTRPWPMPRTPWRPRPLPGSGVHGAYRPTEARRRWRQHGLACAVLSGPPPETEALTRDPRSVDSQFAESGSSAATPSATVVPACLSAQSSA